MYEQFPFENYYAFICQDAPDSIEKRTKVRDLHVARLQELQKENRLLLAGPLLDQNDLAQPVGGLIIAKFSSYAEAEKWINDEPYLKSGAYIKVVIKPYKDVFAYIPTKK